MRRGKPRFDADAAAIFFRKDQPADLHVIHHLPPIAIVRIHQIGVNLPAEGADLTVQPDTAAFGEFLIDRFENVGTDLLRDEKQRAGSRAA